MGCPLGVAEEAQKGAASAPDSGKVEKAAPKSLEEALAKLEMPGVKIRPDKWCVDVESRVCLRDGLLELIACTKDTKEHESIIRVEAKPSHIHVALLLLKAVPGNPAMRKPVDAEMTRFIDLPPRGDLVDVFLVVKDKTGKEVERPISDFIVRAEHLDGLEEKKDEDGGRFPTHSFVFAGSILSEPQDGKKQYASDFSGHVISLSTFGDELLCLPGFFESSNEALVWGVKGDDLPEVDQPVTLRLRPQKKDGKPKK